MRTTLQLDDEVYEAARSMAAAEQTTIGRVISRLVRRALQPDRNVRSRSGIPMFDVPDEAPLLTPDTVRRALEDE